MTWSFTRSILLRHRRLILRNVAALLLSSGCACLFPEQTRSGHSGDPRPSSQRSPGKSSEAKDQQRYYDIGLQHYSREDYGRAKKAFQHVVDMGPNTPLGQKAQENLRKIQQIERTLQEIESK